VNRGDRLLRLDWTGAAVVGVVTLSLHPWLSELGGLPPRALIAVGMVNLAYAAYSLLLWIRPMRPMYPVVVLVGANLAWSAICVGLLVACWALITPLGVLHLGGEAVWVGVLAVLEWRHRQSIARGSEDGPPGSRAGGAVRVLRGLDAE